MPSRIPEQGFLLENIFNQIFLVLKETIFFYIEFNLMNLEEYKKENIKINMKNGEVSIGLGVMCNNFGKWDHGRNFIGEVGRDARELS
jgi:hypothetical protein